MQSPRIVIMRGEFYLFQYRNLDIVGICGLTQEKLVKDGFDFRILTLREHAVGMAAHDRIIHTVSDAEVLPYLTGCFGRNKGGAVCQPCIVGITENE